jgi:hypothetical protein
MVHPQDLAEPLEAFRGEFSLLARFHFVTVKGAFVMLSTGPLMLSAAKHLGSFSQSLRCLILIDYMTNLLEINQILSRRVGYL